MITKYTTNPINSIVGDVKFENQKTYIFDGVDWVEIVTTTTYYQSKDRRKDKIKRLFS